ncbi:MAG: GNAT family N-acetyltransferase [Myxococcota bacterium]
MSAESEYRVDIKPYEQLTRDELHDIFMLRNIVFVVGQGITAEPEVDGRDPECEHAMLWEGDTLLGTARIFHRDDPQVVGRVAVLTSRQGEGLGSVLMEAVQEHIGESPAELHAQAHLEDWYTRLGWTRVGALFEEANIPHVMMEWRQPNK